MSGKPNTDDIILYRQAVGRLSVSSREAVRLRSEIDLRQEQLRGHVETAEKAYEDLFKLMQKMDVYASGNTGYEGRFAAFVTELYRQLTEGRQ